MEPYDYPIQHFEMMRELADRMKEIPVQILEHTYHYDSFGSWWIKVMRRGEKYRIVYDGKEFCLRLEKNVSSSLKADWQELREVPFKNENSADIINSVLSLINTI